MYPSENISSKRIRIFPHSIPCKYTFRDYIIIIHVLVPKKNKHRRVLRYIIIGRLHVSVSALGFVKLDFERFFFFKPTRLKIEFLQYSHVTRRRDILNICRFKNIMNNDELYDLNISNA